MKKYKSPQIEVVEIELESILCASVEQLDEFTSGTGMGFFEN